MNLLFLGTGPSVAIPRSKCRCAACIDARKGSKSKRSRSAAVVTVGKTTILFDAGPDIVDQLERARIKKVDAVFLTHAHQDAAGGLRKLDAYLLASKRRTLTPVYTDPSSDAMLLKRYPKLKNLLIVPVDPDAPIRTKDTAVTPFAVLHSQKFGFVTRGYLVEGKGKSEGRLAYASDAILIPEDSLDQIEHVDVLALDGAMYLEKRMPTHFGADQSIAIAQYLDAKRLILTQIGHSYPPHDKAEKEVKAWAKQSEPEIKVDLAYDGMRVRV